ncbi:MAG: hypothetical protein EZS28_018575, partial [Streblomastix strix]
MRNSRIVASLAIGQCSPHSRVMIIANQRCGQHDLTENMASSSGPSQKGQTLRIGSQSQIGYIDNLKLSDLVNSTSQPGPNRANSIQRILCQSSHRIDRIRLDKQPPFKLEIEFGERVTTIWLNWSLFNTSHPLFQDQIKLEGMKEDIYLKMGQVPLQTNFWI